MKNINWWKPDFSKNKGNILKNVLSSNFVNEGKYTQKFESEISKLLNAKFCTLTTSGTIAIFLALRSLGVGKEDEVLVPNFTFIATANAVRLCGAKPVFVDIDENNLGMDPKKIEIKISKKTKAIVVVHVSGRSANLNKIISLSKKHNLKIVEDAAEALYSKYDKNSFLGTLGDVGCFSLSPNKIISTGQGGIIVTNNKKIYENIKKLKDQGRLSRGSGGDDIHNFEGYNFKFNDISAVIGLDQLKLIKKRKQKQIETFKFYKNNLNSKILKLYNFNTINNIELPLWIDATFTLKNIRFFFEYLQKKNIPIRKFWLPINKQKVYFTKEIFSITNKISKKSFWLPSSFDLNQNQLNYICKTINDYKE